MIVVYQHIYMHMLELALIIAFTFGCGVLIGAQVRRR